MNEAELLGMLKANPQDEGIRAAYLRSLQEVGERAEYVRLHLERQRLQRDLTRVEREIDLRRFSLPSDWLDLVLPLEIRSPMLGTYYTLRSPGSPPFVVPGDAVQPETVVGLCEAMMIFQEIPAGVQGVIKEVCVTNGQLVEYNQLLFKIARPPRPIHGG